jgi:hypothetical protein
LAPVPAKLTTWFVLMPFRLTGPVNVQLVRLAETETETGRFTVSEIEYAPVASVRAVICDAPLSCMRTPVNAVAPGPVACPEMVMVPIAAPIVLVIAPSPGFAQPAPADQTVEISSKPSAGILSSQYPRTRSRLVLIFRLRLLNRPVRLVTALEREHRIWSPATTPATTTRTMTIAAPSNDAGNGETVFIASPSSGSDGSPTLGDTGAAVCDFGSSTANVSTLPRGGRRNTMVTMGGTGCRALALATSVVLGGCFVAYHPARPHEAAADGAAARLVAVDTLANLVEVSVAVQAATGDRTAGAWLSTPDTSPCAGGALPSIQAAGALHADERVFTFNLRDPVGVVLARGLPTVIDLDVVPGDAGAPRRCLRLPLTAGTNEVEWVAWPGWFAAAGMRVVDPPSRPDPIIGGFLVSLGGGAWVGPVRLRLDWLVGEAGTNRPPGFGATRAELIGGDVAAEIFPIHVGRIGVGVQAGYEYLATDFNSTDGTNESNAYYAGGPRGPRVALRVARLPQPRGWPAFSARPDHWSVGFDVFAARWTGLPGLTPMRYGLALSGEWGRWW